MKAIVLREPGGPERLRLEDVPTPEPGPGEVTVALRAAALNRRDIAMRSQPRMADMMPFIPGSGVGISSRRKRSGPPGSRRTIAFIGHTSLVKSCLSK